MNLSLSLALLNFSFSLVEVTIGQCCFCNNQGFIQMSGYRTGCWCICTWWRWWDDIEFMINPMPFVSQSMNKIIWNNDHLQLAFDVFLIDAHEHWTCHTFGLKRLLLFSFNGDKIVTYDFVVHIIQLDFNIQSYHLARKNFFAFNRNFTLQCSVR